MGAMSNKKGQKDSLILSFSQFDENSEISKVEVLVAESVRAENRRSELIGVVPLNHFSITFLLKKSNFSNLEKKRFYPHSWVRLFLEV